MRPQIQSLVERYIGRGHYSGESNISLVCPFHEVKDGTPFSVNVETGVFQCFSCKVKGGLPKLLRMLGLPSNVIDDELKDIRSELAENRERLKWRRRSVWTARDPFLASTILPESVLKPFEWCPTQLVDAGFNVEWLKYMDIGFDRSNNRITFPIRDLYGNLAGISGGRTMRWQVPKYKVYEGQHKDPLTGRIIPSDYGQAFDENFPDYVFHNHDYLWNYDQVYPGLFFGNDPDSYLIITEGFKACLWLLQCGYLNTVALMGSSMSDRQYSLLTRLRVRIILFLDNDQQGKESTKRIGERLRLVQPGVFIAQYPPVDNCQPDWLSPEEIATSIQGMVSYPIWIQKERAT